MKCKTIHKNLIFFLEGELSEQESAQFETHLEMCTDCAAFAKELSKVLVIPEKEKLTEADPFFYTRLKAKMESQAEKENVSFWRPFLVKYVQPAFFSLLLVAGVYTGIKIGEPVSGTSVLTENVDEELIPYLNEMQTETIEGFLME